MGSDSAARSNPRDEQPPRLIACDLDGTFLSPDGTVSELNRRAVGVAQEAGVPVVFSTGRPVRWLEVVAELPGAHPTVIASNGAVLYDLAERRVVDAVPVPEHLAAAVARDVRAALPGCCFGFEHGERFGYEQGYLLHDGTDPGGEPTRYAAGFDELVSGGPYVKVLVRHEELTTDQLAERVRQVVGDRMAVTTSIRSDHGLVELSAAGVSKAAMLRRYCHRLAVPAETVAAFGDMPNDMDMLAWVGRPYVMANAHPLLLDSGATVIGSNADSAVGRTILGWFAGPCK